MVNIILYLSLQLRRPVQESSSRTDNNGEFPITHPKEKVVGMVCFICCVYGLCCMLLLRIVLTFRFYLNLTKKHLLTMHLSR